MRKMSGLTAVLVVGFAAYWPVAGYAHGSQGLRAMAGGSDVVDHVHHKPGHDRGGPPKHAKRQAYRGGPPPWAPAHGYRAKQGYYYDSRDTAYIERLPAPPLDFGLGRCNREVLGQLAGAAAGATVGSQIGDGRGRLAAVAAGTLLGALLGGEVGKAMDRTDRLCADQALEHAADGQPITWVGDDGRSRHQVVPQDTWQRNDGRYCREYSARSAIGDRLVTTSGTVCRLPEGEWRIVN